MGFEDKGFFGFRDIIQVMEYQVEKNMESQMETGPIFWFILF